MDLENVVKERLNGHIKCAGHCQQPSELKVFIQDGMMLGCYTCSSGYVSLIVQYGKTVDPRRLTSFLSPLVQGNITDEDVRVATRYSWDLGTEGVPQGAVLREAYWKQNYRRTKTDDPHRAALFLCSKCSSFYNRALSDTGTPCPRCGYATA